ncbi:MAG: EAL domain-containing protein [Nitrospira sp.]|nr:EAL domain-containing protein [Nitrospira sp.]
MEKIHSLLKRQLKKLLGDSYSLPKELQEIFKAINNAYIQSDIDRNMLERSLDLSSQELLTTNTELQKTLSLLNATIESTRDGILVVDLTGKIISYNTKFVDMWNIPAYILDSRDDSAALNCVLDQLSEPEIFIKKVQELYAQPDAESYDLLQFKDGRIFERYSRPQRIEDKYVGRVWSFHDITIQKRAEEQIAQMAYFDVLTNLPNRYLFKDRLNQAILYAEKYKKLLAVIYLDLDEFKRVNDTFGHNFGDKILQAVSDRLEKSIRKIDTLSRIEGDELETTVARLGGDEFTILLRELKENKDASRVAQRIVDLFSQPFHIENRLIFITTSIGMALYPNDGRDVDTLLRNADTAMYHAKEKGRNHFQFFSEHMNIEVLERFSMENSLRNAAYKEDFQLYYQPQFDSSTGRIIGVEALIRWMHPEKGMLLPDTFIPISEDSGLIMPIGSWVIRTACEQNKAWQIAGFPTIYVTVNISGIQFKQKNFLESIAQILLDTGLEPQYLELELTESILMEPTETTFNTLNELKAAGVRIAIDDFGKGYSSLGYLKRLPIDTLKIDRSFVRDIISDPDDRAIVRAIISLARSLNLKVIAEGVETHEQLSYLQEQGADGIQGFLLSEPITLNSFTQLLKKEGQLHPHKFTEYIKTEDSFRI